MREQLLGTDRCMSMCPVVSFLARTGSGFGKEFLGQDGLFANFYDWVTDFVMVSCHGSEA